MYVYYVQMYKCPFRMILVPKKKTLIDKEIQTSEQIFEKEQDQQQGEEYERAGDDADEFKKGWQSYA